MPDVQEFPKWLPEHGVVAKSAEEEKALSDGRAEVVLDYHSAEGDTFKIAYKAEAPKAAEKATRPDPDPEAMIRDVQETFTRRKSKRKGK